MAYTNPSTTVARRLTSLPIARRPWSAPTSKYSSVLKLLLFHPQLWLTLNTSGALVNCVRLAPVALAHEMVKYAEIALRGSRYGCGGATGADVAGIVFVYDDDDDVASDAPGEPGREEEEKGLPAETGVVLLLRGLPMDGRLVLAWTPALALGAEIRLLCPDPCSRSLSATLRPSASGLGALLGGTGSTLLCL